MKREVIGTGKILTGLILAGILVVTVACASPSGSPAPSTPVLTQPPSATPSPTPSPSASPSRTPSPTVTASPTSTASPVGAYTISIWNSDTLGSYLVDANGMTLYFFTRDSVGKSTAAGAVLANWPLFFVSPISVPPFLSAPDFAVIVRDDGKKVIMYKGWPLYYYIGDKKPGDTNGQGLGGVWFVINPFIFPPTPFPYPQSPIPTPAPTVTLTPGTGGGAIINSDSIVTAKITAIRQQSTGYPWEMDVLVQNTVDVGNLPNPTKDSLGKVITVKTDQDLTSFKPGDVINAKVKYVGDVPKPGISLYIYNIALEKNP